MTGNVVRNMVGNSNFPATVVQSGYTVNVSSAATNSSLISRNTVHSLTNNSGAAQTSIYAMDLTLPPTASITANVIERNLIHSLVNNSTDNSSQVWGIVQRGSTVAAVPVTAVVKNNMIRLGLDANGNSLTGGLGYIGIRDIQGATGDSGTTVVNYYFNSVYIGGTGVAAGATAASNTYAFNSTAVASTRNYVNNIFWNALERFGRGQELRDPSWWNRAQSGRFDEQLQRPVRHRHGRLCRSLQCRRSDDTCRLAIGNRAGRQQHLRRSAVCEREWSGIAVLVGAVFIFRIRRRCRGSGPSHTIDESVRWCRHRNSRHHERL